MKKITSLLFVITFLLSYDQNIFATTYNGTPANYTTFLPSLIAGDTLVLAPGTYTSRLVLNGKNGTSANPIVIIGSSNLYTTIFLAQNTGNTISIGSTSPCSYLVIKNLLLDGNNLPNIDGVKAEGTNGNNAHHITIEYLKIINHSGNQQTVGISTKCNAWDWIIRKNIIIGAGTGLYLGNSLGNKPFVNGIIENNFVTNTLGYNMEIKYQTDTVRDDFPGSNINGKTIIRNNVFCKELNGSTGGSARPSVLVGSFPSTGLAQNKIDPVF